MKEIKEKVLPRARRRPRSLRFRVRHARRASLRRSSSASGSRSKPRPTRPSAAPRSTGSSTRRTFRSPGRSSTRGRGRCCVSSMPSCGAAAARSTPTSRCPASRQRTGRAAARAGGRVGRGRARARGARRQARHPGLRRRGRRGLPRALRGAGQGDRAGARRRARTRPSAKRCASPARSTGSTDEVERVPPEQAAARDAIWTPDKEKPKHRHETVDPRQQGASLT